MAQPWSSPVALKFDCHWFGGGIPFMPHKCVHCIDGQGQACSHCEPLTLDILIIKLGAIGDIIRATPLLRQLKALYRTACTRWLPLFRVLRNDCIQYIRVDTVLETCKKLLPA